MSPGCLCRVDGAVPGVKKQQNWQQGIGVVYYTSDWAEIHIVPINNGRAIYNGAVVRGDDWRKRIVKDTKWEHL